MLNIISPKDFKTIPWKNGLGETTELAINEHANLDNFIWRLSIASVVNDGVFSDFSGYHRNLVLIEGKGIGLQYDGKNTDHLVNALDVASFDGGSNTQGQLVNGAIKDFNIITAHGKVSPHVHCYVEPQKVVLNIAKSSLCFAYSLSGEISVETFQSETSTVSVGSLAKLSFNAKELKGNLTHVTITGENMIIVQLELKNIEL